jgi:tetratricopeptide (TPR) repeat protein
VWQRYALWEASLNEFERARSVFERALEVDYKNQTTWTKYAEMEMKNKFVNHARNIWDRCVTLFPRVDIYWFKYTYMEELIGAIEQARVVFERWMRWEPGDNPWCSYAKFELRQGEIANARNIYERYVRCHPTSRAYLKYARWEEEQKQLVYARNIYERSLNELHHEEKTEKLLVNFAGGLRQSNCTSWESTLIRAFSDYGEKTKLPSIWFYGDNDSYFTKEVYSEMFARYNKANPQAQLVAFGEFGQDSHSLFGSKAGRAIWEPHLETFMNKLGLPTKVVYPQYRPNP